MQEYHTDQGLQQNYEWDENMVSNPFGQVTLVLGSYSYLYRGAIELLVRTLQMFTGMWWGDDLGTQSLQL